MDRVEPAPESNAEPAVDQPPAPQFSSADASPEAISPFERKYGAPAAARPNPDAVVRPTDSRPNPEAVVRPTDVSSAPQASAPVPSAGVQEPDDPRRREPRINVWLTQAGVAVVPPLRVPAQYTLNLNVGDAVNESLVNGSGAIVPVSDIPAAGLRTS